MARISNLPSNFSRTVSKNCWFITSEMWLCELLLNYSNRTEWSPIRSVIIRVIDKIGRLRTGSPIRQSLEKKKKLDIGYTFSRKDNGSVAEMRDNSACIWHALSIYTGMTCQLFYSIVQLQAWHLHCPIGAQIELVITNHMPEFCYSFDRPQNRFQTRLSFVTAQRFRSIIKAKKKTHFCKINVQWHWLM